MSAFSTAGPVIRAAPGPHESSVLSLAYDAGSTDEPGDGAKGNRPQTNWSHFVRWVGHFRPPLTAFPIATLLGAALAELFRLFIAAPWLDGASRWSIILGAVSAVVTAPPGWAFALDHAG